MQNFKRIFAWPAVCLLLVLLPRVIGIGKFATIDEPWWVISGSNYYYALTHGDFESTIYDYHPAVTTTWVVGAGMVTYFPEYRGFGQGYFDVRKDNFDEFLSGHGRHTLDLVVNSRLIQAALISVLCLAGFFLLGRFVDRLTALFAIVLAADAPYFLGHSRLLNHEGMLAAFALVCLLGMAAYLREGRFVHLLVSGAAFGLAQLTKSSSIVLAGVAGLMILVRLFVEQRDGKPGARLLEAFKILGTFLLLAAAVYVLLWPGMWVAPGRMLFEVYGNAFSYAFQGARLEALEGLQPARSGLNLNPAGILNYLQQWLLQSTPVSGLGVLLAGAALFARAVPAAVKWLIGYLALTAFLFIAMFGIAQGRDAPHYILTSYLCLDVAAGLGWGLSLGLLAQRRPGLDRPPARSALIAGLLLVQAAGVLPNYPYYYTYLNPLLADSAANPYGYGEGLELAAGYLAQKPDASATRAFVYAGMGPFSYFYPGRTEVFKKAYLLERGMPSVIVKMRKSDYLVVYSAAQDGERESAQFLRALEGVPPEHEIRVRGILVARIYRILDIPERVYQELAEP